MKTIVFTLIGILCAATTTFANEVDYTYLKIRMADESEINYPPGTGFIVEDEDGKTVLSPKELEEKEIYEVKEPITLYVFVYWKDEPDVFEMSDGKLILGRTERTFSNNALTKKGSKAQDHYARPSDRGTVNKYGGWTGNSNGLTLDAPRFFDYDTETGYDASLEFSDGTIFYYRDGKVNAWKNGAALEIDGKYMIKTNKGTIKLSYNPETMKIWWVFDKND